MALLILLVIVFFYTSDVNFTGEVVLDRYSFTKAICNETNYCQDYEIICNNNELIDIRPIIGAAIQQDEDWKDPRDIETRDKLC